MEEAASSFAIKKVITHVLKSWVGNTWLKVCQKLGEAWMKTFPSGIKGVRMCCLFLGWLC